MGAAREQQALNTCAQVLRWVLRRNMRTRPSAPTPSHPRNPHLERSTLSKESQSRWRGVVSGNELSGDMGPAGRRAYTRGPEGEEESEGWGWGGPVGRYALGAEDRAVGREE